MLMRNVIVVLTATLVGCVAWVAWGMRPQADATTDRIGPAASAVADSVAVDTAMDLEQLLAAIDRPQAFRAEPERQRARSGPATRSVSLASIMEGIELAGISGGEAPKAILRNRRTGEIMHVGEGQVVEGLTVLEVGPRHVLVSAGPEQLRIDL